MAAVVSGPRRAATLDMRYQRPPPLGVPLSVEGGDRVDGARSTRPGRSPARTAVTVEASAMFIMPTLVRRGTDGEPPSRAASVLVDLDGRVPSARWRSPTRCAAKRPEHP